MPSRTKSHSSLGLEGENAEHGKLLVNLLSEDHSRSDKNGRHQLVIEAYGYRWCRVVLGRGWRAAGSAAAGVGCGCPRPGGEGRGPAAPPPPAGAALAGPRGRRADLAVLGIAT